MSNYNKPNTDEEVTFSKQREPLKKEVPYWRKAKKYKSPDAPESVGWTTPRVFFLSRENGGKPFELECGRFLKNVVIEYEMYGELNEDRSNAILITHALSGDGVGS